MRSCIYCGRELEKGEVCNCPQAAARRAQKSSASGTGSGAAYTQDSSNRYNTASHSTSNTYQTGYTHRDNAFKRAWNKHKAKASARRHAHNQSRSQQQGFWKSLGRFIVSFAASPVETISNPGYISKGMAMVIAAISGALINLCLYFIRTGAVRSPFGIVLSLITLNPMRSYSNLLYIGLSLLSGAVSGILLFFIYTGVFWFLTRFLVRQRLSFWEFAPRLSLAPIPLVLTSIIGILFGMFSSTTLAILLICGLIGMIILTYEALRTEWISFSPGKAMYAMMLGFFIFTAIICYIIRLS